MDNICSKLSRANGIIPKLRRKKLCISVYCSIFYFSRLLYDCLVWSYANQSNIAHISKSHKCCFRIFSFSDFNVHTNGIFFELESLKIADIFKMQKVIFMFDFINNDIRNELQTLFYN